MSILSDLAEAWPMAIIAAGVGFVVAFGRDPEADEHDVSDYHEPARIPAPRKPWSERDAKRKDVIWNVLDDDILPPAPPGMDAGSPLWRELTVAAVVPTLTDEQVRARAAAMLREIRDEALAGVR